MTIEEKLENGYLPGCIKYMDAYNYYLMPIAYWILDNDKYDPDYDPKQWEFVFRNNIMVVHDNDIPAFFNAIEIDRVDPQMFKAKNIRMTIFIDFDTKLFVSSFNEIELENYLPDESWKGLYTDPNKYIII